jgi:hypothetical protein
MQGLPKWVIDKIYLEYIERLGLDREYEYNKVL